MYSIKFPANTVNSRFINNGHYQDQNLVSVIDRESVIAGVVVSNSYPPGTQDPSVITWS